MKKILILALLLFGINAQAHQVKRLKNGVRVYTDYFGNEKLTLYMKNGKCIKAMLRIPKRGRYSSYELGLKLDKKCNVLSVRAYVSKGGTPITTSSAQRRHISKNIKRYVKEKGYK